MKFEIDNQTLEDLAIFQNKDGGSSIFSIFNKTITYGGGFKLKEFFSFPLTDAQAISQRLDAIKYLQQTDTGFTCEKGPCDFIEHYLQQGDKPTRASVIDALSKRLNNFITPSSEYYIVERGIGYTLQLLQQLHLFTVNNTFDRLPQLLQQFYTTISETFTQDDFKAVLQLPVKAKLSAIEINRADHLFRYSGFKKLSVLLDIVYRLDAFITVALISKTAGYTFPVINHGGGQKLVLQDVFHPSVNQAVPNSIDFDQDKNICFITGANMAGKSTFLKAVGVSVYLSQIGFPVPAVYMETGVFKGLITTINLADNTYKGNSHFYNEVLRVKHVAQKMQESQRLMVIFDELFRGTNVKDAYDASLAVIKAFAQVKQSFFIISTHIVEVATELKPLPNINFKYMETTFDAGEPQFSYQLRDGITEERLGMWIVNNEGIVAMINNLPGV